MIGSDTVLLTLFLGKLASNNDKENIIESF